MRYLLLPLFLLIAAPLAAQSDARGSNCPTGFEIPPGVSDGDEDCVPDNLERTGFTLVTTGGGQELGACTPGTSETCYVTDPTAWSSDGDPYSDFQEATGINMDNSVEDPYRHPLVAAAPHIDVSMTGYVFTPRTQITDQAGRDLQVGFDYNVTTTRGTTNTIGGSVGASSENGLEASAEGSHAWSESTSFSLGFNFSQGFNWSSASAVDTEDAATLAVNVRVANSGGATASNVLPTFNVYIAGELIATLTTPSNLASNLTPGDESPEFVIDRRDAGGVNTEDITLTLEQLKLLELGAPLEIRVIRIDAEVERWDPATSNWACGSATQPCRWETFENQIEARTLRLVTDFGYSGDPDANIPARYFGNPFDYYVYTGSPSADPEFTLRDVLGFVGLADGSGGSFAISGRPFPSQWAAVSGPTRNSRGRTFVDHWQAYVDAGGDPSVPGGLLDMPMPRESSLALLSPSPDPREAGPVVPLAVLADDLRSLTITASPKGGFAPVSATARLYVQGELVEVELEAFAPDFPTPPVTDGIADGSSVSFRLPAPFALPFAAQASYVVVRDSWGNATLATFETPYGPAADCEELPFGLFSGRRNTFPDFERGNVTTVFVGGDPDLPATAFCAAYENLADTHFWAPQFAGRENTDHRGIALLDAETRIVVGDNLLSRSTDGGATWTSVRPSGTVPSLRAVAFREGTLTGLAVGASRTIYRTTDGGETWSPSTYPGTEVVLEAVDYAGGNTWYAAGGDRVIRSLDDGRTWASVPIPTPGTGFSQLTAVEFISETEGVIGDRRMRDNRGRVYATTDGGATWDFTVGFTGLEDIAYNGSDRWVIAGGRDNGILIIDPDLLATTDDSSVPLVVNGTVLTAVDFGSEDVAFASAQDGRVFRTEDGGQTWAQASGYPTGPQIGTNLLLDIDMLDPNVGGLAGTSGVLGTTDSGGGVPTYMTPDINVPSEPEPPVVAPGVVLEAPAPNPFRSVTRIGFSLPEAGHAHLAVYDVRGREVAVLADGLRPSGEHEARFDARDLAAGVYVVRLVANGEATVRRVTLVR